jgi:hypothetical protein
LFLSDNSDKISIYSVQKLIDQNDTSSEKIPSIIIENIGERSQNALKLLGVKNSSVYLSNCTIWVEGVTDKLYLSKYISQYLSHDNSNIDVAHKDLIFQEGVHYSFVYSGGDNIVHLDFTDDATLDELSQKVVVKNLCGRAMVIVDNDNGKNHKRKKQISDKLGCRFIELPVIEIENLLSKEVIIKTIKSFETCKDIDPNSIPAIKRKDINSIRMGTLIEKHLLKNIEISGRKKFEITSVKSKGDKMVNNKLGFCEKAIEHISYKTMSEESIDIAKQIICFIQKNNSII